MIKTREFKENSLIITVLHPYLGKQEFLAKGGKRPAAKLTPWLGPLSLVTIWPAPSRAQRPVIREVEVKKILIPPYPLALRLALRIVSLLDKASQPSLECSLLFERVTDILSSLCNVALPVEELKKKWIEFEVVLLSFLGLRPTREQLRGKDINEAARYLEQIILNFLSP